MTISSTTSLYNLQFLPITFNLAHLLPCSKTKQNNQKPPYTSPYPLELLLYICSAKLQGVDACCPHFLWLLTYHLTQTAFSKVTNDLLMDVFSVLIVLIVLTTLFLLRTLFFKSSSHHSLVVLSIHVTAHSQSPLPAFHSYHTLQTGAFLFSLYTTSSDLTVFPLNPRVIT